VRYASGASFTVTQLLSGFEHHCALDIGGSAGALRAWWSGADARTLMPEAGLSILRRSIAAFRAGQSPMDATEARRSVLLCLAVEQSCRTGGTVAWRSDDSYVCR
jgi:hypothetical protein